VPTKSKVKPKGWKKQGQPRFLFVRCPSATANAIALTCSSAPPTCRMSRDFSRCVSCPRYLAHMAHRTHSFTPSLPHSLTYLLTQSPTHKPLAPRTNNVPVCTLRGCACVCVLAGQDQAQAVPPGRQHAETRRRGLHRGVLAGLVQPTAEGADAGFVPADGPRWWPC